MHVREHSFRVVNRGGGGQFLLGMCRWPLETLPHNSLFCGQVIDPILVTFNSLRTHLATVEDVWFMARLGIRVLETTGMMNSESFLFLQRKC